MILAAVISVCANTAVFSAAVYAAEADPLFSATENVSIDSSTGQNTAAPESDGTAEKAEITVAPESDGTAEEAEITVAPESDGTAEEAEITAAPESDGTAQALEMPGNPETAADEDAAQYTDTAQVLLRTTKQSAAADAAAPGFSSEEHHLAFASDYHSTEGSIENALSGMPEDVEYVSLIGDMVGDRGGSHPEYESGEILDLVREVFPKLDSTSVSIVWATHDLSVNDEGTGIVKCMDGESELIREGTNEDNSPAYYIYGIGHYDMSRGDAVSAGAASAFKEWVKGINHTIPVIVLCHVPIQASRGDNHGAFYWNEALNYAATGTEGITTTDTTADIIRNVLFLHGHNHTNDPQEYYFGAGTTLSVQVDKSQAQGTEDPHPRPGPGGRAEGVLSNIFYTSLTAGYLKTSGNATLVTVADGALTLTKYNGGQTVGLGVDGNTKDPMGDSVTIAAQRHNEGQGVKENTAESTCEHGGSYDLAVYCTICGMELDRTHIETEAAGHHWGNWAVIRAATETAEGEESRSCSVCGKTESRPIFAHSPEKTEEPSSTKETDNSSASEHKSEEAGANVLGTTASPQTGDQSQWILWVIVLQLALISLAAAGRQRTNRE